MGVDFPRDDLEGFFELLLPDEKTRGFAEVLDRLPASIFIVNDLRRLMTEKGEPKGGGGYEPGAWESLWEADQETDCDMSHGRGRTTRLTGI